MAPCFHILQLKFGVHLSLEYVLLAMPVVRDLFDHRNILCSVCRVKVIIVRLQICLSSPWCCVLSLSAVKYGHSSVYEHFIHENSPLGTTIICTIFQQRTSFHAYKENGLNTKYSKGRKRSFWRCFLLQNCFYVTVFRFLIKVIKQ